MQISADISASQRQSDQVLALKLVYGLRSPDGACLEPEVRVEDWDAVAAAINARMRELRMTQMEVAAKSSVSIATIRELQHNTAPRRRNPRTLAAISTALRWPSDHLERVGRGDATGEDVGPAPSAEFVQVMAHLDAIQDQLHSMSQRVDHLEQVVMPESRPTDPPTQQGEPADG
jgi:hypothetical protein